MNQFPPNRMAIAALAVLALFVCAERAQAADISGTISSTVTITEDTELVGDVTCAVPLTLPTCTTEFRTSSRELGSSETTSAGHPSRSSASWT